MFIISLSLSYFNIRWFLTVLAVLYYLIGGVPIAIRSIRLWPCWYFINILLNILGFWFVDAIAEVKRIPKLLLLFIWILRLGSSFYFTCLLFLFNWLFRIFRANRLQYEFVVVEIIHYYSYSCYYYIMLSLLMMMFQTLIIAACLSLIDLV